jgi:hypothetical protein
MKISNFIISVQFILRRWISVIKRYLNINSCVPLNIFLHSASVSIPAETVVTGAVVGNPVSYSG